MGPAASPDTGQTAEKTGEGTLLAGRYRILGLLGEGGMGAVYKVLDLALDRVVALKTIHGPLARNPRALEFFKNELILARQVTHKNVCRVFDFGQDPDGYFLTMEYVEGQSLGNVIRKSVQAAGHASFKAQKEPRRGRIVPVQAAEIMLQVAQGLDAAHETGIVHRDLKPDNIMIQADGRVLVMDFGIARPVEELGASFSGTPAYASPEQLQGQAQDRRSDLFSFGLIFYELLSGELPFPTPKSMTEAREHAGVTAPTLTERASSVPKELSEIVARCLAPSPERRYATAHEVAAAIENWLHPKPLYQKPAFTWSLAGGIALLAVAGMVWTNRSPRPAPPPVSVLIADFDNKTGESVFDGTLEPAVQVAMEGASFITAYDRGVARKLIGQLRPSRPVLDAEGARLVAAREGIAAVLSGSIEHEANRYRLSLRTINPADGKDLSKEQQQFVVRDQILAATGKLAAPVRRALGDATPASEQNAAAETFTAASLEAANKYSQAQEFASALGRPADAVQAYEEAIRLDPAMGRAYAGLAVVNRNMGRPAEALRNYELALSHTGRMSDREKLRTRGGYYITSNNPSKAAEEFSALVQKYPADTGGHSNLALALLLLRQTGRALEEGQRSVEIYPKNLQNRNNVALYAMYAGDYQTATREATAVLKENPLFEKAYIALALSSVAQERPQEAQELYRRLAAVSSRGASMASTGMADLAVVRGQLDDAVKILQQGIAVDKENNRPDWAAHKYADLAEVYIRLNRLADARRAAELAVGGTTDLGALTEAALTYIDAGASAPAEVIAANFRQKVGAENQVAAMIIEGYTQMAEAPVQAIDTFGKAQKTLDTWLGHFLLGRANLLVKEYAGANDELEACLKRSGEATAVFLDDVPTARLLPPVWYYLAQAEEGLNDSTATESYRHFLSFQFSESSDPFAVRARAKLVAPKPKL
jgi:tetratricopeptide (TPR) repeat protein